MELRGIGVAVTARSPTARLALGQCPRQHEADASDGLMEALGLGSAVGIEWHLFRFALNIPPSWHDIKYSGAMADATVAGTIERYCPRVPSNVARFAKEVTLVADPSTPARARALLFALTKLGCFAVSIGAPLDPAVCLSPAMIERFIVVKGTTLTSATRRTVRSNLRFVAARVLAHNPPTPIPLSRERAKAPYSDSELAAYFFLAAHQPTEARRHRASGLLALGAGAGLTGADLRGVKGCDVLTRSGGLVVEVSGTRPRVVPVLARYHDILCTSARFARSGYVVGGNDPYRRNVTTPLVSSLSGGDDLPRLQTSRLRSTWLVEVAGAIGLANFLTAAGVTCTQRLGDLVASLGEVDEQRSVALLGRAHC
jgi:integrase